MKQGTYAAQVTVAFCNNLIIVIAAKSGYYTRIELHAIIPVRGLLHVYRYSYISQRFCGQWLTARCQPHPFLLRMAHEQRMPSFYVGQEKGLMKG